MCFTLAEQKKGKETRNDARENVTKNILTVKELATFFGPRFDRIRHVAQGHTNKCHQRLTRSIVQ